MPKKQFEIAVYSCAALMRSTQDALLVSSTNTAYFYVQSRTNSVSTAQVQQAITHWLHINALPDTARTLAFYAVLPA